MSGVFVSLSGLSESLYLFTNVWAVWLWVSSFLKRKTSVFCFNMFCIYCAILPLYLVLTLSFIFPEAALPKLPEGTTFEELLIWLTLGFSIFQMLALATDNFLLVAVANAHRQVKKLSIENATLRNNRKNAP